VTLSSELCLQAVSTPAGLASLLLPPLPPSAKGPASEAARGPPSVWWIYHALALFEKALRRAAPHHPAAPPHGELPGSALGCFGISELLPPLGELRMLISEAQFVAAPQASAVSPLTCFRRPVQSGPPGHPALLPLPPAPPVLRSPTPWGRT
jgi:hypothetical protein